MMMILGQNYDDDGFMNDFDDYDDDYDDSVGRADCREKGKTPFSAEMIS